MAEACVGSNPEAQELLDVKGVAIMLRCSPRHVHRLRDAKAMPAPVRLGTLLRWSRNSLDQWIINGCPKSAR